MAVGENVVLINAIHPPSTSFAQFGVRVTASSPPEQVPHWAFDAATDEYLDFYCTLNGYSGGNLAFTIKSMAATATTGGALISLSIRRINDDAVDVDTAFTYTTNAVEVRIPCASASGEFTYDTITLTSGAQMNSLANNEDFILRMRRRGTDNTATTGDDMSGDFQMVSIIGLEA